MTCPVLVGLSLHRPLPVDNGMIMPVAKTSLSPAPGRYFLRDALHPNHVEYLREFAVGTGYAKYAAAVGTTAGEPEIG